MFKLFGAIKKHEEFEETKEVPREGVKEIETSQSYANTTTWSIVMLPAIVVHISDNIVNPLQSILNTLSLR